MIANPRSISLYDAQTVAVSRNTMKYTALGIDGRSVAANKSVIIAQKIAEWRKWYLKCNSKMSSGLVSNELRSNWKIFQNKSNIYQFVSK